MRGCSALALVTGKNLASQSSVPTEENSGITMSCPGRASAPSFEVRARAGLQGPHGVLVSRICASRVLRWIPGLVQLAQERSLPSPGTRHPGRHLADRPNEANGRKFWNIAREGRGRRDDGCLRVGSVWCGRVVRPDMSIVRMSAVTCERVPDGNAGPAVPDYACAPSGLLALGCPKKARDPACPVPCPPY